MTNHVPVMLDEVLVEMEPSPGGTIVDGTLGGGGHTQAFARAVGSQGVVIATDQDPAAISAVEDWDPRQRLCVRPVLANFADLPEVLDAASIDLVDGVFLDLGLSSDQLADDTRGFSFASAGCLDLRFNPLRGEPAYRLLERLGERHLADLIYRYGEERHSRRIARKIVDVREQNPIRTSQQLRDVICRCVPPTRQQRIHPATRTFQALRIAVNEELKNLEIGLRRIPDRLRPGGRLAIISFHSLEDRLVKHSFREDARLEVRTKKPLRPTAAEVERNPRSRSARLRIAQRI